MNYYKYTDESGQVTGIGTGSGGVEITHEEYERLLSEIREKVAHVEAVYADPAKIDAVPAEWRDEILRRVEERRAAEEAAKNADISPEELGRMMMEVL